VENVHSFTFGANTLIVEKDMKALVHPVVQESGKLAMHSHFNEGAYDLQTSPDILGGFSFFTSGATTGGGSTPVVDLPSLKAREVSFGYNVKFSAGFQWNKGGKLPGLFGGTNENDAATCSGGRHADTCFSTRMMWRRDGQGELYLYIPPDQNRVDLCGPHGTGQCVGADNGVIYGASVGTGNFYFKAGDWTAVREVIHINTPGQKDGWAAVYVNGASSPSIYISDISFGANPDTYFYGQQMQTFFGGHTTDWASPQSQDIWFADFTLVVNEQF